MSEKRSIRSSDSSAKRQRLVEQFGSEFEELPPLAKIEFMQLTSPDDIVAVCSVSKAFRDFCNNDLETQTFWKEQLRKMGKNVPADARLRQLFPDANSWFQAFLESRPTLPMLFSYARAEASKHFPRVMTETDLMGSDGTTWHISRGEKLKVSHSGDILSLQNRHTQGNSADLLLFKVGDRWTATIDTIDDGDSQSDIQENVEDPFELISSFVKFVAEGAGPEFYF